MRLSSQVLSIASVLALLFVASVAFSWTGPSQAPTGGNVSAPVNVSSTAQTKSGTLGVNGLAVFGNTLLSGSSRYLNWGSTAGDAGYGIWDDAGTIKFKNSGGNWAALTSGGVTWLTSGNNIYNANSANVGIGTVNPTQKLDVQGGAIRQNMNSSYDVWIQGGASTSGGDDRNLAMLGIDEDTGDYLVVNYGGEYAGGTQVHSSLTATSFLYSSDARLKTAVTSLKGGLAKVLALSPVSFVWKADADGRHAGVADIGFIAQDVEQVLPELVTTGPQGYKAVDYVRVVPVLVGAIQEQQAQINSLKSEVEALKAAK